MEQELRNALRRNVGQLRELLLSSGREQIESRYGIQPDSGTPLPDSTVPHVLASPRLSREREEILAAIAHEHEQLRGKGRTRERAVEMFLLQSAFTTLNRLAALKVMERRDLLPECLGKGEKSEGVKLFRQLSPAGARTEGGASYRRFLELLCDDVAGEVRILFDRTLPPSHLFPEGPALDVVLDLLNDEAIEAAWDEDEVLGWVYQYFTPKNLRDRVREESRVPRNTYEMAIRNQFYTPDYVVRFLADNTLGRLWWEAHPESELGKLEYLVRRKNEKPPSRVLSDVQRLRVLDPACGSGHFLHYCFKLFRTIYREAYHGHPAGAALRSEYPEEEQFERKLPALILQNNLFGIDIDLRAAQLTALSLYLRAKRAHPDAPVQRVNAVLAEPMPGEAGPREEFLERVREEGHGRLLAHLLEQIFDELDLAGEVGTLLQAEGHLRDAVADARQQIEKARREGRQIGLTALLGEEYKQGELPIERLPPDELWRSIEDDLLRLLTRHAEEVTGNGTLRRLFADDAAHGIGFVDALMRSYDVVLMNPPFGATSKPSKKYVDSRYPRTKNNVYAAFVERGLQLMNPGGYLGAITGRDGFFLTSFQKWREEILLEETDVVTFVDLGHGVLDTAAVETAAFVLRKRSET